MLKANESKACLDTTKTISEQVSIFCRGITAFNSMLGYSYYEDDMLTRRGRPRTLCRRGTEEDVLELEEHESLEGRQQC